MSNVIDITGSRPVWEIRLMCRLEKAMITASRESDDPVSYLLGIKPLLEQKPPEALQAVLPHVPEQFRNSYDVTAACSMWDSALILALMHADKETGRKAMDQACEAMGIEFVPAENLTP